MSDGKIWSEETTELLVDLAYETFVKKVPFFLRGLVKPLLRIGIKFINEKADKVVPDKIDGYVNDAIQLAKLGEYDAAAEQIGIAGDMLVNLPLIDDNMERELFISIAKSIVNAVRVYIENKKA